MKLVNFFKSIDCFYYKPSLFFKKKPNYKNSIGGIVSFFFILTAIYVIYLVLLYVINDDNRRTIMRNKFFHQFVLDGLVLKNNSIHNSIKSASPLIENHQSVEKNFLLIFQIVKGDSKNVMKPKDLQSLGINLKISSEFTSSGDITIDKDITLSKTLLPLKDCNFTNFENYYCIDVMLFKNQTNSKNLKVSLEKIHSDSSIQNLFLHTIVPLRVIDYQSKELEQRFYFYSKYQRILSKSNLNIDASFSPVHIKMDLHPFLNKIEDYLFEYNFEPDKEFKMRLSEPKKQNDTSSETLMEINYQLSDKYIVYTITADKTIISIIPIVLWVVQLLFSFLNKTLSVIHERYFYSDFTRIIQNFSNGPNIENKINQNDISPFKVKSCSSNLNVNITNTKIKDVSAIFKPDESREEERANSFFKNKKSMPNSNLADSNMSLTNLKNSADSGINPNLNMAQNDFNQTIKTELPTIVRVKSPKSGSLTQNRNCLEYNSNHNLKLSFAQKVADNNGIFFYRMKNNKSIKDKDCNIDDKNSKENRNISAISAFNPKMMNTSNYKINKIAIYSSKTKRIKQPAYYKRKIFSSICTFFKLIFTCKRTYLKSKVGSLILKFISIDEIVMHMLQTDTLLKNYTELLQNENELHNIIDS